MECQELKVLKPVLITPSLYLPMDILSKEQVAERQKVSTFRSVKPPYCNYVSFEQLNPENPMDGLSALVDQPGSPSVFQLITSQLSYKLNWKLTNRGNSFSTDRIRLLVLNVDEQRGYEPWDIKGNRIEFVHPRPGRTTTGCAIIPGQYLFFVIEDPSKSINFEITITAFYPRIERWEVYGETSSDFCLKDCYGNSFFAYNNSISTAGRFQRTLNPQLLDYEARVIAEYRRNPGFPCLVPPVLKPFQTEENLTISVIIPSYFGFSARYCGNNYANPSVNLSKIYIWVAKSNNDDSQFILDKGKYKLDLINVSGTSPTLDEFSRNFSPLLFTKGPHYGCNTENFTFIFYSVPGPYPVVFNRESSNPPPLAEPNIVAMKIDKTFIERPNGGNYVKFDVPATPENNFIFDVPDNGVHFAFRLNSPIWEADGLDAFGREFSRRTNSVDEFKATIQLTKLS